MLVVGATGILGPAAAALVAGGASVLGVSRGARPVPDGVIPVAVDAHDADALAAALAARSWTDALVYGPAVSADSLRVLRASTPGGFVLVRTSSAADPARGILVVPDGTLQLGWSAGPDARWHTPAEVSDAALDVLGDGRARTLGVVRPWADRP